jgi:hypothetical protein
MSDTSQILDSPLEQAAEQLDDLAQRHQSSAPSEASSLVRMRAHLVNMKRAVMTSTEDHANAAKRLADFSLILGRMANSALPNDEQTAARFNQLALTLKDAGKQLASADATPSWASSKEASH